LLSCGRGRDGFIAGTTNPYFKEKCDWDVLADLEGGKVVIRSPKVEQLITGQFGSSMSEKSNTGYHTRHLVRMP
jgi:hypothetical protein